MLYRGTLCQGSTVYTQVVFQLFRKIRNQREFLNCVPFLISSIGVRNHQSSSRWQPWPGLLTRGDTRGERRRGGAQTASVQPFPSARQTKRGPSCCSGLTGSGRTTWDGTDRGETPWGPSLSAASGRGSCGPFSQRTPSPTSTPSLRWDASNYWLFVNQTIAIW
jgi:hypothetical protein